MAKQKEDLELAMKKLTAENRREICDMERDCLTKKQELLRGGVQGHPEWWNQGHPPPKKSGVTRGRQSPQCAGAASCVTSACPTHCVLVSYLTSCRPPFSL